MDPIDSEVTSPASSPLHLSSEQRQILDHLCLCRERGANPHQGHVRPLAVILFLGSCLAICVGLIVFASQIPPAFASLIVGFIVGVLLIGTRWKMNFERQWPLLEWIIDWKFVDHIRKAPEPPDGNVS